MRPSVLSTKNISGAKEKRDECVEPMKGQSVAMLVGV